MSIMYEMERLQVIPGAEKLKDYALSQKETLAEAEFEASFSRERLLKKLMEKAQDGEAGYTFFSSSVRPQIAERLRELVEERWMDRLTALGYHVNIEVKHSNSFYSSCRMQVVWNLDGWEASHCHS